jgi:hypothetical protein
MHNLEEAISVYEHALGNLFSEKCGDPASRLLAVLLARSDVAAVLKEQVPSSPNLFNQIATLDKELRSGIPVAAAAVDQSTKKMWRDTIQPSASEWWWSLEPPKARLLSRSLLAVAWIAIAIALSFIVEIVKRFLTGGVYVASISAGCGSLPMFGSSYAVPGSLMDRIALPCTAAVNIPAPISQSA